MAPAGARLLMQVNVAGCGCPSVCSMPRAGDATMPFPFRDREDAARQLGEALAGYRGQMPLVLAIPRGGVPIGRILADLLGGELDVVLVRKLGAPSNPEFAIGAVDERGEVMLNENAAWTGADDAYVRREAQRQLDLIRDRRRRYREGHSPAAVAGRTVIVVDDGLATGATMIAALRGVRAGHPSRLVCALPVAAADSLAEVARYADDVVCLATPSPFHAVGLYYRDFSEVGDDEVSAALGMAADQPQVRERAMRIAVGGVEVDGDLVVPASPQGLVLFAHGSGSSRHSARNRFVASALQQRGIATLLMDLLTPDEDVDRAARFDIGLLVRRLHAALHHARKECGLRQLPVGLFGASTGAAAAVQVAAEAPEHVAAVVSRGGRPDLVDLRALSMVRTPTLLIVGGADREVLDLNRRAQAQMGRWADLVVVPGATHLFEEPGALEQVAALAAGWFARHFRNIAHADAGTVAQAIAPDGANPNSTGWPLQGR
jgi:predicted phosphoribosyltransferase/predicted alpha/beta-hydrolase family hydrolase